MDDLNITMEEYMRLEEEKGQRHSRTFNWKTATYGKVKYREDEDDCFTNLKTKFPAIVFDDTLTPWIPASNPPDSAIITSPSSSGHGCPWVLLLQGFNIEIKDKKGAENLAADHLSRLKNPTIGELAKEELEDKFPDEHLMISKTKLNDEDPWYADYVNYLVRKVVLPEWTPERKNSSYPK
ncbi:hypothetical protein Tco_0918181 [Tanacetum coccineum]